MRRPYSHSVTRDGKRVYLNSFTTLEGAIKAAREADTETPDPTRMIRARGRDVRTVATHGPASSWALERNER